MLFKYNYVILFDNIFINSAFQALVKNRSSLYTYFTSLLILLLQNMSAEAVKNSTNNHLINKKWKCKANIFTALGIKVYGWKLSHVLRGNRIVFNVEQVKNLVIVVFWSLVSWLYIIPFSLKT